MNRSAIRRASRRFGTDGPSPLSQYLKTPAKDHVPQVIADLRFPYRFEGFPFIPEAKPSFLFKQVCAYSNLSEFWLLEHFKKIFQGTLYSMAAQDEEFLAEYLHPALRERILAGLTSVKSAGLSVC